MDIRNRASIRQLHTLPFKRTCSEKSNVADLDVEGGVLDHQTATGTYTDKEEDVVFYVGHRRKAYHVSSESLACGSAYFRSIINKHKGAPMSPMVLDCDETVFEALVLLMRYGSWEALPPLSPSQAFSLRKEAETYGVQYIERSKPSKVGSPLAASPSGSPKVADISAASPLQAGRVGLASNYDGVRLAGSTSRQLSEMPDFPHDLADPTRLLLASCIESEKASIFSCEYCARRPCPGNAATQWALSFHYRHAFCTRCGRPPVSLSPKHFAEMFMGAATQYSTQSAAGQHDAQQLPSVKPHSAVKWSVRSDSTCILRLVISPGGSDACASASCSANPSSGGQHPDTIWATNFFYSHAFCTRCVQSAHSSALLSALLVIRYGSTTNKGSPKFNKPSRIPTSPTCS
ncbi:hypothetical protein KP509_01G026500 [Ceratopteris richardii]|uniref:BTB domain-containing protein n=1 Tax=Ceratopteris richardii TaxID=49495 RepID=A0A8T2VJN6_CERRI|nr:hypothetical protein KP509_01G026500 [Ceratopteris richardii]